jgi:hypothetical protein
VSHAEALLSQHIDGVGPGRVAHRRHQERVERALFGPAHHVGARRSSITARLGHGVGMGGQLAAAVK